LTRLNAEADEALKKAAALVAQERCDGYVHYSVAWAGIARYARDHGERCGLSASALSDIDARHRKAVEERVNACGGLHRNSPLPKRDRLPFPAEIRPRW